MKIQAAKPYDYFNKYRNEEEEAIRGFLSGGGSVKTLVDSKSAKETEARVRKQENDGARFIFSKDERLKK